MPVLLFSVLVILCLAGLMLLLLRSMRQMSATESSARQHFEQRFGSVDAMLVLSELDKNQLRFQRDQGRMERWDAIRDVMRIEHVPEDAATEFIDRL